MEDIASVNTLINLSTFNPTVTLPSLFSSYSIGNKFSAVTEPGRLPPCTQKLAMSLIFILILFSRL